MCVSLTLKTILSSASNFFMYEELIFFKKWVQIVIKCITMFFFVKIDNKKVSLNVMNITLIRELFNKDEYKNKNKNKINREMCSQFINI